MMMIVQNENPSKWRPMVEADLVAVNAIANKVHLAYPEDEAVFAERLKLYPSGCFVLAEKELNVGYIISHPWHFKKPPDLNSMLTELPDKASTYYLHDIALLPFGRGTGAAPKIVEELVKHAHDLDFPNISLVAVNNSAGFWERHGFHIVDDAALDRKLSSYDDAARFMVRDLTQ